MTSSRPSTEETGKLNLFKPILLTRLHAGVHNAKKVPLRRNGLPPLFKAEALGQLLTQSDYKEQVGETVGECVRFVLDLNNKLIFGKEGHPGPSVPAHREMLSVCYAAGNMVFNAEGQLIKVSNKSSNFIPPFDTLQFALDSLIAANIPLSDFIEIEQYDRTRVEARHLSIKKEELLAHLTDLSVKRDLERVSSQIDNIENGTKSPARRSSLSPQSSPTKRFLQASPSWLNAGNHETALTSSTSSTAAASTSSTSSTSSSTTHTYTGLARRLMLLDDEAVTQPFPSLPLPTMSQPQSTMSEFQPSRVRKGLWRRPAEGQPPPKMQKALRFDDDPSPQKQADQDLQPQDGPKPRSP